MCLIVDANILAQVLAFAPSPDFQPLQIALYKKKARAAYGGQLAREYLKLGKFRRLLAELDRQGVFRQVPDSDVDAETVVVRKEGFCISNDPHIIALARVAQVRLLCSHDRDLHADFTDRRILHPPGSVYQDRSHQHLIRRYCRDTGSARRERS